MTENQSALPSDSASESRAGNDQLGGSINPELIAARNANQEPITRRGLASGTGNRRTPLSERGHDLYETPAVAVEALLRVEQLPHRIWEPAAGRGAIVRVLRAHGHEVVAQDLVDYSVQAQSHGRDFLLESRAPDGVDTIVTNPPFMHADKFVAHALELCPRVVMLLRLAFLESQRRTSILEGRGLARIHVFRKRLPMMHRAGWEGRKGNSGMAFCWMVWDPNHIGPACINRISWEAQS
jgi:hypothetical protein